MQYDIPLVNIHFKDVNPVTAGWEQCDKKHYFGSAIRHFYLIHYILSGKGVYKVKDKIYNLSEAVGVVVWWITNSMPYSTKDVTEQVWQLLERNQMIPAE